MLRLWPIMKGPWLRPGQYWRGDTRLNDFWMRANVLNSCMIPYDNDTVLCSVRGFRNGVDEADIAYDDTVEGMCLLKIDRTADMRDLRNWEILKLDAPILSAVDTGYTKPNAGDPLWISQLAIATDPDVVTGGHTTIIATFKLKQPTGTAPKGWAYSTDGGESFTFGGFFKDELGNDQSFGQTIIWKDNAGIWHLIGTVMSDTDKGIHGDAVPCYYTSTGPDTGTGDWTWTDGEPIGPTGYGNGLAGDTNRIGVSAFRETDDAGIEWVCVTATVGNGKDKVEASALAEADWTDPANLDPHSDYPNAVNAFRCKVIELGTGAWEAYPHNPIAIRNSIGNNGCGGMWNGSSVKLPDGSARRHSFEMVGIRDVGTASLEQRDRIRNQQYGKGHSYLRLPTNAVYDGATGITFYLQFVPHTLGTTVFHRGVTMRQGRETVPEAGSYYVNTTPEGAVEVIWYYENTADPGPGAQIVKRRLVTQDGLITPKTEYELVVSLGISGVTVTLDGVEVATSEAPHVNGHADTSGRVILFGGSGHYERQYKGFIVKIAIADGEVDYPTMASYSLYANRQSTVGYFLLTNVEDAGGASGWDADFPASPDSSPTQNHIQLRGPAYDGDTFGKTSAIWLPGMGASYDVAAGSAQYFYDGPAEWWRVWDDDPFEDGCTVRLRNLRTGKYLARDGTDVVSQDAKANWVLRWAQDFVRLNADGGTTTSDLALTVTSIDSDARLEMQAIIGGTDLQSPYTDYDMQHWHLIDLQDGTWMIQNRGCGRALVGGPAMEDLSGGAGQLWKIEKVIA